MRMAMRFNWVQGCGGCDGSLGLRVTKFLEFCRKVSNSFNLKLAEAVHTSQLPLYQVSTLIYYSLSYTRLRKNEACQHNRVQARRPGNHAQSDFEILQASNF